MAVRHPPTLALARAMRSDYMLSQSLSSRLCWRRNTGARFCAYVFTSPSDFDLACYCCSRRSVVIMLLLLMAWPSRTSWSAWKFPQRCSPHRPDPRESATSRAEPVFLLVPGTHSSKIHPSTTNCHFSPLVRVAPSQCRSATWSRRSAGLGPSYELLGVHTTSLQPEHLLV